MDSFELLSSLASANGVSGEEQAVCRLLADILKEIGEVKISDCTNSVICSVGEHDPNKPTVLLDAHIDEIGMIVTYITDEGFLKVSNCGGLDNRVLLAQQVTVLGDNPIAGIVTSTPPHLETDSSSVAEIGDIYIDIGMTKEQAEKAVSLGDRVVIENKLERLAGNRVTSKALDNRAGVASVVLALDMIKGREINYNVTAVFASQEEVGERGAKTSAYEVNADMAIVVDVSFAKTNGESEEDCGLLGKGAMIGFAPSLSRKMSETLVKTAKENGIPYQIEVMNGKTGTDADEIGISRGGTATVTLSVPQKHMHTPVEIVDIEDIENTARLIVTFLES